MSFRCADCKTVQEAGTRPVRVTATYAERDYNNNGTITLGWEVVTEKDVCATCAPAYPTPEHPNTKKDS